MGYENNEISELLTITTNTSKSHVKSIMRKLNVKRRTGLALVAIKLNLVDIDDIDISPLLKRPGK